MDSTSLVRTVSQVSVGRRLRENSVLSKAVQESISQIDPGSTIVLSGMALLPRKIYLVRVATQPRRLADAFHFSLRPQFGRERSFVESDRNAATGQLRAFASARYPAGTPTTRGIRAADCL
jgi:hypothetical protein